MLGRWSIRSRPSSSQGRTTSKTRIGPRSADEATFDGIYMIRTTVRKEQLSAGAAVRSHKGLSRVERTFRRRFRRRT